MAATVAVSPVQLQLLRALIDSGGACAYRQVFRLACGFRWEDIPVSERRSLVSGLNWLERRKLVTVERRWGTWGYGQPETVHITESGRAQAG
jgi:hypothetical protein